MKSPYRYGKYQTPCKSCGETTTNQYARKHKNLCKRCFDSQNQMDNPSAVQLTMLIPRDCVKNTLRNERILEHGYMNYAREEDHF
jgi:hypothetical protein